jgi:hypothetical protein
MFHLGFFGGGGGRRIGIFSKRPLGGLGGYLCRTGSPPPLFGSAHLFFTDFNREEGPIIKVQFHEGAPPSGLGGGGGGGAKLGPIKKPAAAK